MIPLLTVVWKTYQTLIPHVINSHQTFSCQEVEWSYTLRSESLAISAKCTVVVSAVRPGSWQNDGVVPRWFFKFAFPEGWWYYKECLALASHIYWHSQVNESRRRLATLGCRHVPVILTFWIVSFHETLILDCWGGSCGELGRLWVTPQITGV